MNDISPQGKGKGKKKGKDYPLLLKDEVLHFTFQFNMSSSGDLTQTWKCHPWCC